MILMEDIIKAGHPTLKMVAEKVETPISKKDLAIGKKMLKYLEMSQDDKMSQKYKLRAGVGLAAPQINVSKRFFAVLIPVDEDETIEFVIYNPEIIAESVEMIYLRTGEGCLSVPDGNGTVLRHKKIKFKGFIYDPITKVVEEKTMTLRDYPAIVFQHEFDHLNGILFTEKITKDVSKYDSIY